MNLRFVSVVGSDTSLLAHSVRHYKSLGVEDFHVIRHVESTSDPSLLPSATVMNDAGLKFHRVVEGPWDEDLNARLIRETMAEHPDDWWVVADLDEFQVYDRPLAEVVESAEHRGYDHVRGSLLDRVGPRGTLPDPDTGDPDLWSQFPLAGTITLPLLKGVPVKVTLARGDVHLGFGQHTSLSGVAAPATELHPQVHHFKWTASVVDRLSTRVAAYTSGRWHLINKGVVDESRTFLEHVKANGGVDTADPGFGFQDTTAEYSSYRRWPDVVRGLTEIYEL